MKWPTLILPPINLWSLPNYMSNRKHGYRYYENKACQFFPCHPDLWDSERVHNCMFCFCPLYSHEHCGGNPKVAENGMRDCSDCTKNHDKDSYDFVLNNFYTDGEYFDE